ncbi:TolC family protein [Stieleria sp. TO1_6]|uniref:TolC family protein n=1 Tax=Stieleria tagensis TaxID=2956795 RepID=UPI00209B7034|nr:TolC family protein [Stieleria tagensis]MCO8121378.1 TolC family protein [Stieleria tagensis]
MTIRLSLLSLTVAANWFAAGLLHAQTDQKVESKDSIKPAWLAASPLESPADALESPQEKEGSAQAKAMESTIAGGQATAQIDVGTVHKYLHASDTAPALADDYHPWWEATATKSFQLSPYSMVVQSDMLILSALRHSPRIAALNENVTIANTSITRAAAEFDPTAFVESRFVRTSVPTGSSLEAGVNRDRLREENFSMSGGLRRRTETGAQFEIGQQIGLRDSNSQFFTPANQGNSRLTLSFDQPLLNGAGKAINCSLIVLAKIDTQIAIENTTTVVQDHLLAVNEAMWNLYFQRTSLLLRIRHLELATAIHDWLENRQDLDALTSQVKRAEAAVATRKSELARAVTAIRNAEDQLRVLVSSPELTQDQSLEIIPARPPSLAYFPVSLEDAVVTALQQRSEINQVARQLDAARVRMRIARNEMLPMLDLVLETYVSGLRGQNDISQSWVDQFSVGEPSYSAGLLFEVPLYRRAAKANVQRRQAELRQLADQMSQTIQQLHAEVAAAVREVETSYREMNARYIAMVSAEDYMELISRRWRELPGEGDSSNLLLDDLLNSQDRLLVEEVKFAQSQIDYALSTTRLKRATGSLLQIQPAVPY